MHKKDIDISSYWQHFQASCYMLHALEEEYMTCLTQSVDKVDEDLKNVKFQRLVMQITIINNHNRETMYTLI